VNEPPADVLDPAASAPAPAPPRLAEGVELIGEYADSGFTEAPYVARRADGQTLQLTHLLYAVAQAADGRRDAAAIAEVATEAIGRTISADNVRYLVEEKLRPRGVLAAADGSSPQLDKPDPLLALRFRVAVVPAALTNALTTIFRPLFLPPVVAALVLGFLALDAWLFTQHGVAPALRDALYQPLLLVGLLGGVVLATAFHEIGHATACRYGGARPGAMGAGLYIVWPAFYTDVTDAYRLGRAGRLRTDLGGVYFNAIFALAAAGAYAVTRFEPLLLLVLIQNVAMLQQALPFLRLDGYHVLCDLTGVPDMHSRIRPVLRSLRPGSDADPRVAALKPRVRAVVTAYVLAVVPLLVLALGLAVLHAPRVFATAWDALGLQWDRLDGALDGGAPASIAAGGLQLVALALPVAALCLTLLRVSSHAGRRSWRWSGGSPARRGGLVSVAAAGLALLAFTWAHGDYRPIQPGERGTLQDGVRSFWEPPNMTPGNAGEHRESPAARGRPAPERAGEARTRARDADARGPERRRPQARARAASSPRPSPSATATPGGASPLPAPTSTSPAMPGTGTVEADADAETPAGDVGAEAEADAPPAPAVPLPGAVDDGTSAIPTVPPVP
jgi:putative peptide zinc metalloprotease protein